VRHVAHLIATEIFKRESANDPTSPSSSTSGTRGITQDVAELVGRICNPGSYGSVRSGRMRSTAARDPSTRRPRLTACPSVTLPLISASIC
jgi:hypothetical protein